MKTINATQLKQRLDRGDKLFLVEALPRKYYEAGHLPGALHLPLVDLRTRAPRLLPNNNAEIIVYCASPTCENSHLAARELEGLGYTDVTVFAGGKEEWKAHGYPLTSVEAPAPVACACA